MTRRFRAALAALPFVSLWVMVGCSTGPRVIESSDGASRPSWATVMRPVFEDDGRRYFVGYVEVDGDASRSSALNMADEKALSEPMRSLADLFLDQNQVGESLRRDGTAGQRIISATRSFRMPMPGLQIVKRYWETVQVDEFTTATRAYALAEVTTAEYEKAKRDYFARLRGDSEVAKILREVGQAQREAAYQSAKEKR